MEVNIQISGMRSSGRTNMATWIKSQLRALGATVSIGMTDSDGNEHFTVSASPDFLSMAAMSQELKFTTKPLTAIEEATKVIYGDREQTYGDPSKNLRVIAEYWTTHLKASNSFEGVLTPDDICVMMILLKQARLANSPKHRDSIVDTIGYAALADRINNPPVTNVVFADNGGLDKQYPNSFKS